MIVFLMSALTVLVFVLSIIAVYFLAKWAVETKGIKRFVFGTLALFVLVALYVTLMGRMDIAPIQSSTLNNKRQQQVERQISSTEIVSTRPETLEDIRERMIQESKASSDKRKEAFSNLKPKE